MTSRQRLLWMVLALVAAARADIEAETKALEARLKAFAKGPERGARGLFAETMTASLRPDPLARPRSDSRGGFHVHHASGAPPEAYTRERLAREFPHGTKLKVLRSERRGGALHTRIRMTRRSSRAAPASSRSTTPACSSWFPTLPPADIAVMSPGRRHPSGGT